ncbi:MAG TPA: hypothetical protein PKD55_01285 [Bellilinea sp.]|nr:hypothetical protein [Bellilinea sp.]
MKKCLYCDKPVNNPLGADTVICSDCYAECMAVAEEQARHDRGEQLKMSVGEHHPDCSCNKCRLGEDTYTWLYDPEEY